MAKSTSADDRVLLMRWMFSALTLHPDLSSMSNVTSGQRDELSKKAGALYQKLLVDSCRNETTLAIQNEGPQTVEYAFQVLGSTAARGMMTEPHVLDGLKAMVSNIDMEKMKSLAAPKTP